MALYHTSDALGSFFTFGWCPDHVGIEGNKEAEAAARFAANSPEAVSYTHLDVYKRQSYNCPEVTITVICPLFSGRLP